MTRVTPRLKDDLLAMLQLARERRAEQKAHAARLIARIREDMTAMSERFFEIGRALVELRDERLHVALGHRSFDRMVAAEGLPSARQSAKLMHVATAVPRAAALRLGLEKAFALTRYASAVEPAGGVKALLRDGEVAGRSIADLSVRELTAMTRKGTARSLPRHRDAERLAREVRSALRQCGLPGPTVRALLRSGKVVLRIELDESSARRMATWRRPSPC